MEQHMDHSAGRMKRGAATRGETLVETIVAFSVLMILLTMVLTVVRGGVALNNRASANLAALYSDCRNVEQGSMTPAEPDPESVLTLTYVPQNAGAGAQTDYTCTETVEVYHGDMLYSFQPKDVTGG